MITTTQCVASTVLVDPPPPDTQRNATCPCCGATVAIVDRPARYVIHSAAINLGDNE